MQTFLPYADYARSAQALDDRRLGKQRVEAYQILLVLQEKRSGWKNHPAVKMWADTPASLADYAIACCDEWLRRSYQDSTRSKILELQANTIRAAASQKQLSLMVTPPAWLGDERLHSSHRAALLWKANADMDCIIATRRDWANSKDGQRTAATLQHYRSQGWTEEPRLNYWWPV